MGEKTELCLKIRKENFNCFVNVVQIRQMERKTAMAYNGPEKKL